MQVSCQCTSLKGIFLYQKYQNVPLMTTPYLCDKWCTASLNRSSHIVTCIKLYESLECPNSCHLCIAVIVLGALVYAVVVKL